MKDLVAVLLGLGLVGCGVKGDPLPPEKPALLGTGQPIHLRSKDKTGGKSGDPQSNFEYDPEEENKEKKNEKNKTN